MRAILQKRIDDLENELISVRRNLHQEPELSYQEYRTTAKLRDWLSEVGIKILDLPLETGLVAEIGTKEGPIVAIRGDIDALPIEEQTGLPFASQIPGKMHACGHDFHTATILGAAYLLKASENELPGKVRVLFQAAEETGHGAEAVLQSGGLDDVQAIFGLHNRPELASGAIGSRPGALTAGVDRFEIEVEGVGAHAAAPESGVDSIVTSAQIVMALQTIVSRMTGAQDQVVLSVTRIEGGNTWNVLPKTVTLEGTVRTHDESLRKIIPQKMKQTIEGISAAMGANAELKWYPGPPATVNHEKWVQVVQKVAEEQGYDYHHLDPQFGGEDFSLYLEQIPGAFLNIGTEQPYALHHPSFDIDEKILVPGAEYFAALAKQALSELEEK
ncbi:amidohydrolase [Gracilibacillus oryzae]|uniref:Amidohydrolase n=1 Tax=Gracilibacillus oryzae TaxID=1672701 RepID=A0A7C8GQL0_9BACI|nr:amidohydrolase [Gracilibacillus oryzae]KAB8126650.1 amidohydrolase [Gracilibacillus oryzae]